MNLGKFLNPFLDLNLGPLALSTIVSAPFSVTYLALHRTDVLFTADPGTHGKSTSLAVPPCPSRHLPSTANIHSCTRQCALSHFIIIYIKERQKYFGNDFRVATPDETTGKETGFSHETITVNFFLGHPVDMIC